MPKLLNGQNYLLLFYVHVSTVFTVVFFCIPQAALSSTLSDTRDENLVTSMLILDDILPQNHALKELQKVLNSHTNPVETFKSIETFDKIDVAQRRLEFLYSNGYIRGATPTLPQVNLTSAPKK